MKKIFLLILIGITFLGRADEGMYLPFQLKSIKDELKASGLELSTKEIYNTKKPSVKDAIVSLGGFCTGEIISPKGLMLTNHHCGFDAIRENSTPEHDYLTDGFWAKNYSEEKPIPGLTASIVVRIEDVTKAFEKKLNPEMTAFERQTVINDLSEQLAANAVKGTHYNAEVKPFYTGNEFYLFVYEVFQDVRLVGAPPSSIGKYGGDTDNWMWERHTGDFSMFRIYANESNEPALFAMNNVPYTPKHHLPISLKGVEENDFAMIMGYPGTTDRYVTSYGVQLATQMDQPARVQIRGEKLRLMKEDMNANAAVRIQYASTYAQVSNYWKYFIGQTEQLENNGVLAKKVAIENAFTAWINEDEKRALKYGNVLADINDAYREITLINPTEVYFFEAIYSITLNKFLIQHIRLYRALKEDKVDADKVNKIVNGLRASAEETFASMHFPTEEKLEAAMFDLFYTNVPEDQQPEEFSTYYKEFNGKWDDCVKAGMKMSIFTDLERYTAFLDNPTKLGMEDEILFVITNAMLAKYLELVNSEKATAANAKLENANRLFIEALREMNPNTTYYPNANFSLRLTYGNILPYTSITGKEYAYYTTMTGLMAKEDPSNEEFIVPARLKELYEKKDYGRYGKDGDLWVNFITNNDITGGNSGSPVMNSRGELIGCAFDGNWEAMSGDISFEKDFQRTICADIRYILFVIDKYAGASHLIDEMTIIE